MLSSEMLNEYDLINKYRKIFLKFANKYRGKPPSMEEIGLHYLNEYTSLIGTLEYLLDVFFIKRSFLKIDTVAKMKL